MGIFDDIFGGGGRNPAKAAEPFLSQIPGELKQYYDPYVSAGTGEINPYLQQLHGLTTDPTGVMSKIGSQFQTSPGYHFALSEALRAANMGAAAQGLAGTPAAQQRAETVASGLAGRDYNQYMQNALGQYRQGLAGERGMVGMGEQASTGLAQNLAQALMSHANLAYAGQENQNQMHSDMWKNILGLGSDILGGTDIGSLFGGGDAQQGIGGLLGEAGGSAADAGGASDIGMRMGLL